MLIPYIIQCWRKFYDIFACIVQQLSFIQHRMNMMGFLIDFAVKCCCLHGHPCDHVLWFITKLAIFNPWPWLKYVTLLFLAIFSWIHQVTWQAGTISNIYRVRILDSTFKDCLVPSDITVNIIALYIIVKGSNMPCISNLLIMLGIKWTSLQLLLVECSCAIATLLWQGLIFLSFPLPDDIFPAED